MFTAGVSIYDEEFQNQIFGPIYPLVTFILEPPSPPLPQHTQTHTHTQTVWTLP